MLSRPPQPVSSGNTPEQGSSAYNQLSEALKNMRFFRLFFVLAFASYSFIAYNTKSDPVVTDAKLFAESLGGINATFFEFVTVLIIFTLLLAFLELIILEKWLKKYRVRLTEKDVEKPALANTNPTGFGQGGEKFEDIFKTKHPPADGQKR